MDWRIDRAGQRAVHSSDRSISQVISIRIIQFVVLSLILTAALLFFVEKKLGDDQTDKRLQEALTEADRITEGTNTDYMYNLTSSILNYEEEESFNGDIHEYLKHFVIEYEYLDLIFMCDHNHTIIHSSDDRLEGAIIGSAEDMQEWIQIFSRDFNETNYYNLGVLSFKPVDAIYGKDPFDYVGIRFLEDNIFGEKGTIMLMGTDMSKAGSWRIESLESYIQYADVGSDGFFLLLKEDEQKNGTYAIVGGKDVLPEIYRIEGEEFETVLFPEEKYQQNESFSWKFKGKKYRCIYKNVEDDLLVAMFPESGVVGIIGGYIITTTILLALFFVIFGIALRRMLGSLIEKPIQSLNESVNQISNGNLDVTANVRGNLEFSMLTDEINIMVLSLKRHIKEAAARVDKDLAIAKSIQLSTVPGTFPAFPGRTDFDIYAFMESARKVGGDFYDFFLIDNDHLALVMADVSDKGIPAAMFMMKAKAKIHDRARRGGTPAEILFDVNNSLGKNNKEMIFVTVWLAIIELSTGRVLEANAGHEHPAVYQNESYRLVKYHHSPPLATLPDLTFTDREFTLKSGDRIFVYTDGVTDATNREGKRFGEDGLIEALNELSDSKPKEVIEGIMARIDSFAEGVTQFDDITMCAFTYLGAKENEAK